MSSPFIGEIKLFAGNFAPVGWALCNGQVLSITQNTALFSLLGTNFGGNGTSNFALPNLQGAAPLFFGQGAGLSEYVIGNVRGLASVALESNNLPSHNHEFSVSTALATSRNPTGNVPAVSDHYVYAASSAASVLGSQSVTTEGDSEPHNNWQPYLVVNYIIALTGIFPSRP